jgi:hypothetical protein
MLDTSGSRTSLRELRFQSMERKLEHSQPLNLESPGFPGAHSNSGYAKQLPGLALREPQPATPRLQFRCVIRDEYNSDAMVLPHFAHRLPVRQKATRSSTRHLFRSGRGLPATPACSAAGAAGRRSSPAVRRARFVRCLHLGEQRPKQPPASPAFGKRRGRDEPNIARRR